MRVKKELIVSGFFVLFAFSTLAQSLPKGTVAVVNGRGIPQRVLEATVLEAVEKGVEPSPQLRDLVLSELIKVEVVAQRAKKLGFSAAQDLKARVSFAESAILARSLERFWFKRNKPKERELRAAYENRLKAQRASGNSFDVFLYQLTVSDEAQAQELMLAHKNGQSFDSLIATALAGQYLVSGNLSGWRPLDALAPRLAQAVVALDKGDITVTPIKTSTGWLLVKVLDKRESVIPSFESSLEELKVAVMRAKWADYLQKLEGRAVIKRAETSQR